MPTNDNKFQFLYGAIKRNLSKGTISLDYHFNSYMVRLKEAAEKIEKTKISIFQFLYGAIKRKLLHLNL